jgi:hypothetical protein
VEAVVVVSQGKRDRSGMEAERAKAVVVEMRARARVVEREKGRRSRRDMRPCAR